MELTAKQIELGAKFLAADNTGLVGLSFPKPTSIREIEATYSGISYEYEQNLGEDLDEEKQMFTDDIRQGKFIDQLQKDVPFIFEVGA